MDANHPEADARARYRGGAYNRRVAAEAENMQRRGSADDDTTEFLCTCGRHDCDEILVLELREYDRVRERPYRFVTAPGHNTSVDDVVAREDEYWIVELKRPFRLE